MNLLHRKIPGAFVFVYQGDFCQKITKSILTTVEQILDVTEENPAVKRKVFKVMVESLQNIVKHSKEPKENDLRRHPAVFMVGREPHGYSIMSGNPVHKEMVPRLKSTLDRVNSVDRARLKDLYKHIIQGATLSDKGGAGLGFVDMVRKSGENLLFEFPEISETWCLFYLKVHVSLSPQLSTTKP